MGSTALANERILSVQSGILEPSTVHGEVVKVYFSDINAKAKLLHGLQLKSISFHKKASDEDDSVDAAEARLDHKPNTKSAFQRVLYFNWCMYLILKFLDAMVLTSTICLKL